MLHRKSKNKIYDIQKAEKLANKDKELEIMRKTSKYRSGNSLGKYGRRLFTEGLKECYKQVAAAQGGDHSREAATRQQAQRKQYFVKICS